MVRIRHGMLVIALGVGLVSACKKDEKKADPAKGDVPAEKGGAAPTAGAAAGDDLSLLPLDSELVLGINVAQVQQSSLWKQFVEPKLAQSNDTMAKLAEFKAKCGFDPLASLKSVSLGMKGVGEDKPDGVIVVHGLDKTKSLDCFEKMKDEMTKEGTEYSKSGDVVLLKNTKQGDQTTALTFVNDNTLVAVVGTQATPDGIKAVVGAKSTLKTSPQFVDMYSKVNSGDSLWGLMNGNSKAFDKMGQMGAKPKAMFGSVNVTDGLSLDMRMRFDTPDAATQLATMAQGQLQPAQKMFDKADVKAEGNDVHVTVVLSSAKLTSLIQQFGGMFGAGGGQP